MSDEDQVRLVAYVKRMGEVLRPVIRDALDSLCRVAKAFVAFALRYRQLTASDRWAIAQRSARFLANHPDLSKMDRWLDRWYSDPVQH